MTSTRSWAGKLTKIRVYYDSHGNTLNVWFDDPKKEFASEETGEEVILVKDRRGRVIGFEKLNFLPGKPRMKAS
jgi:uncharacterized protein YuzE